MSTTDPEANVDGSGHSVRSRAFPTSSIAPDTLDRTRSLRKAFICLCFVDLVSLIPENQVLRNGMLWDCDADPASLEPSGEVQNKRATQKSRRYLRRSRSLQ